MIRKFNFTEIVYYIKTLPKRIWFRAFIYALIGVLTAVLGLFAGDWVPPSLVTKIGSDAVGNILAILASSMLAVSTFSLSIMVTAFGNVSTSATPRASKLLIENQKAQGAVSTFIGAFLYSIVAIIALATGAYGEQGRFVLFVATILVILLIVVTLIGWVDRLSTLGRIGDTIEQIESAALKVFKRLASAPNLGGKPKVTSFSHPIKSHHVGFVAYINLEQLQKVCERENLELALELLPGSFAYPDRNIATCSKNISTDVMDEISSHFLVKSSRTFDQDPRFGLVLLSEIASRALSPAVNDPGTAIEVIGSATRILKERADLIRSEQKEPLKFERIFVPGINSADVVEDVFSPIARIGSGNVEVAIKFLRSLHALAAYNASLYAESAKTFSELLLEHAEQELKTDFEKTILKKYRFDEKGTI